MRCPRIARWLATVACYCGFHKWGRWHDGFRYWTQGRVVQMEVRECRRPGCNEYDLRAKS
jgi:hypothetical protein